MSDQGREDPKSDDCQTLSHARLRRRYRTFVNVWHHHMLYDMPMAVQFRYYSELLVLAHVQHVHQKQNHAQLKSLTCCISLLKMTGFREVRKKSACLQQWCEELPLTKANLLGKKRALMEDKKEKSKSCEAVLLEVLASLFCVCLSAEDIILDSQELTTLACFRDMWRDAGGPSGCPSQSSSDLSSPNVQLA